MQKAMREFNGAEPESGHDEESRFVTVRFRLAPHAEIPEF